jgi:hypothetical protein
LLYLCLSVFICGSLFFPEPEEAIAMEAVRALAVFLFLLATAAEVRADVLPLPSREPFGWVKRLFRNEDRKPALQRAEEAYLQRLSRSRPFVVEVDEQATQPRLVIPRSLLGYLQNASLPGEQPSHAASRHALIAGLFLSLTLASGGLWLARQRSGLVGKSLLAGTMLVALGCALTWANPPEPPRLGVRPEGAPQVLVEIADVPAIQLTVSREQWEKLVEQAGAKQSD